MTKHRAEIFARVRPTLSESNEIGLIAGSGHVEVQARRVGHSSNIVNNAAERITFPFMGVFDPSSAQGEVFERAVYPTVKKALDHGYSAAVLAYGQSGSGKTYTMMGGGSYKTRGVMQRAIGLVFSHIAEEAAARKGQGIAHRVQLSFVQVYNEQAYDLLGDHAAAAAAASAGAAVKSCPLEEWPAIGMSEGKDGILHLSGLRVYEVPTEVDALRLLLRGHLARATSSTTLNAASSRSHALLQITITTSCPVRGDKLTRLHLVDLAGSERVGKSAHISSHVSRTGIGFSGLNRSKAMRVKEGVNINLSLHHLELCLIALISRNAAIENASKSGFLPPQDTKSKSRTDGRKDANANHSDAPASKPTPPFALPHIPYRNSVLTSLLRDALGGACLPVILACLAPEVEHAAESISTCRFAVRAARLTARAIPSSVIASHALGGHASSLPTPNYAPHTSFHAGAMSQATSLLQGQEAFPLELTGAAQRELQQSRAETSELRNRVSALEDEIKVLRMQTPLNSAVSLASPVMGNPGQGSFLHPHSHPHPGPHHAMVPRPTLNSDIVQGNAEARPLPMGSSFGPLDTFPVHQGRHDHEGYPSKDTVGDSLDTAQMGNHASSKDTPSDGTPRRNPNSYSRIMPLFKDAVSTAASETDSALSSGSKQILENEVLGAIYSQTSADDVQQLRKRILTSENPEAALDFTISTMFRCIGALQEELMASTQEVCELQNQVFEYSDQLKEANEEVAQLKQKLSAQVRAEVAALSLVIEKEAKMLSDMKKEDLSLSEITGPSVADAASVVFPSANVSRRQKYDRLSLDSSLHIELEENDGETPSPAPSSPSPLLESVNPKESGDEKENTGAVESGHTQRDGLMLSATNEGSERSGGSAESEGNERQDMCPDKEEVEEMDALVDEIVPDGTFVPAKENEVTDDNDAVCQPDLLVEHEEPEDLFPLHPELVDTPPSPISPDYNDDFHLALDSPASS